MTESTLADSLQSVISQRLLRRKCAAEGCGEKGVICLRCNGLGYVGSCLLAEWLPMTPELRRAILVRGDGTALTAAASCGDYTSLREEAERLVGQGLTSREEVSRVLGAE